VSEVTDLEDVRVDNETHFFLFKQMYRTSSNIKNSTDNTRLILALISHIWDIKGSRGQEIDDKDTFYMYRTNGMCSSSIRFEIPKQQRWSFIDSRNQFKGAGGSNGDCAALNCSCSRVLCQK
jgi:hypothetical protein